MRKPLGVFALLVALPAASSLGATFAVSHEAPACGLVRGHMVLEATVPASAEVASLRVYFRGAEDAEEYYLEMRELATGRYQAVLPRPAAGVDAISYRFVARNGSAAETASASYRVPVDATCAAASLSESQLREAENLVLGRTGQDAAVVGFECEGVVAQIGANGDLTPSRCGEAIEASSESGPASVSPAARAGLTRVAPTDRARRVVSRSRP
jgi:hypothetical protein